jgi:heat shock protein HtpX
MQTKTISSKPLSSTLLVRVILTIALVLLFYLGTAALTAGLIWWPVARWHSTGTANIFLFIFAWLSAFWILRGFWLARDVFEAPGPEIFSTDHPRLFAFIQEIASASGESMPDHVYLTVDMNAFVGEVGGFLGFGRERIMVLGMGVLSFVTESQLRGVLAHELGHFQNAHLWQGAQVYRTRALLVRVLAQVEGSLTHFLFRWYAYLFLWVSRSISREQEKEADLHAIRHVGPQCYKNTLMRMSVSNVLFEVYFEKDVHPLFEAGYYPSNIFEGFRDANAHADRNGSLTEVEPHLRAVQTDPYDSHPSLAERLDLVAQFSEPSEESHPDPEDAAARSLLEDPNALEEELSMIWAMGISQQLKKIAWADVGEQIVQPAIEERRHADRQHIARITRLAADAPLKDQLWAILARLEDLGHEAVIREMYPAHADIPERERISLGQDDFIHTLGIILGSIWVEEGACWATEIGRPFLVEWNAQEVEPVERVRKRFEMKDATQSWREYLQWDSVASMPPFSIQKAIDE